MRLTLAVPTIMAVPVIDLCKNTFINGYLSSTNLSAKKNLLFLKNKLGLLRLSALRRAHCSPPSEIKVPVKAIFTEKQSSHSVTLRKHGKRGIPELKY